MMSHIPLALRRLALPLALGAALSACESAAPQVATARPLYRLGLTDVISPPSVETTVPGGASAATPSRATPSHAYTIAVRLEQLPVLGVAVRGIEGAETITAPRLTVYPDQRANLSVLDQHAFVQDFDVEVLAEGTYVADPIIGVLQDGLTLDLLVKDAADGHVRLGFAVQLADSGERHPERELLLQDEGSPVTIQLPAVELRRMAGVVDVALGTEVVLFEWPGTDGRHLRAVAAITRVDLQDSDLGVSLAYVRDDLALEREEDDPTPDFHSEAFEDLDLRALTAGTSDGAGPTEIQFVLLPAAGARATLGQALPMAESGTGASVLDRVVWASGLVPGSRYEARLMESYVSERLVVGAAGSTVQDPRVSTLLSGVSASAQSDGTLLVEWVATPEWSVAEPRGIGIDRPESRVTGAVVPVTAEGVFVPLARTEDGRVAGVTVVSRP